MACLEEGHCLVKNPDDPSIAFSLVHEDNLTNGPGAEISAMISEQFFEYLDGPIKRVAAKDSPIPFNWVIEERILPQTKDISNAIEELLEY